MPYFGFSSENPLDVALWVPKWTRLSHLKRSAVSIPIEKKWLNCACLPHSMLRITTNYLSVQMNESFVFRLPFHQQTKVITSTIQHQMVRFNTSFDHVASAMHTWIDWISGSWTIRTGTSNLQFNTFWERTPDLLVSMESHYFTFILDPFGSSSFIMSYLPQRINYRSLMC